MIFGRFKILIVDDVPDNIKILADMLREKYVLAVATSGEAALAEAMGEEPPDLILLDVNMPGMDGYQVCAHLKNNPATRNIPVLFVTIMGGEEDEARGLALGAADYIAKPVNPPLVMQRVHNHLMLKAHRDNLEQLVRAKTDELLLTRETTIQCMATLAETRDHETGGHIKRTKNYVRLLAQVLAGHPRFEEGIEKAGEHLYRSAPLHDIGKVGIPDGILFKPGKLGPEEFQIIKGHARIGWEALSHAEKTLGSNSFLGYAAEIAYTHHEKWDGSGYPRGLAGDDIPVSGRLMALADVYDALISRRVYKPPFPHSRAVEIIAEGSGSHFDPAVVEAFKELAEEFRGVAIDNADYDEEQETLRQ